MSSSTADALGLSRAILCNGIKASIKAITLFKETLYKNFTFFFVDGLLKKLDELERTSELYKRRIDHTLLLFYDEFLNNHT